MVGFLCGALIACSELVSLDKYYVRSEALDGAVDAGPCTVVTPSDDTVRACVMAMGCSPFVPDESLASCLTYDSQFLTGKASCLRRATSCSDVTKCVGYGVATSAQCPASAAAVRCAGNVAIECSSRVKLVLDCNVLGGTCDTYRSSGTGTADRAGCRVTSSCAGTTSACSGTSAYECRGGKGFGVDCAKSGGVCGIANDAGTCFLKGPSCSRNSPITCSDDTIGFCSGGGRLDFDCAKNGLSCTIEKGEGWCVAPGCTVADVADAETCSDSCASSTTIKTCVGGAPFTVDCTAFGFTTCESGMTAGKQAYAICR